MVTEIVGFAEPGLTGIRPRRFEGPCGDEANVHGARGIVAAESE